MAREPKPMYGSFKKPADKTVLWPWAVMAIAGAFVIYVIVGGEEKRTNSNQPRFYDGCDARWADYGSRVLTVQSGDATILTCMVMVEGKWTPEANVKVTP